MAGELTQPSRYWGGFDSCLQTTSSDLGRKWIRILGTGAGSFLFKKLPNWAEFDPASGLSICKLSIKCRSFAKKQVIGAGITDANFFKGCLLIARGGSGGLWRLLRPQDCWPCGNQSLVLPDISFLIQAKNYKSWYVCKISIFKIYFKIILWANQFTLATCSLTVSCVCAKSLQSCPTSLRSYGL